MEKEEESAVFQNNRNFVIVSKTFVIIGNVAGL